MVEVLNPSKENITNSLLQPLVSLQCMLCKLYLVCIEVSVTERPSSLGDFVHSTTNKHLLDLAGLFFLVYVPVNCKICHFCYCCQHR